MFQRAITFQEFADLFEQLCFYQQADAGLILTTTGRHPQLGAIVAIQDLAPAMILLSEHPFTGA